MKNDEEKKVLNKEEIKEWAGSVAKAAKDTIDEVVDNIKVKTKDREERQLEAKYKKELLLLRPVFREMLQQNSSVPTSFGADVFTMPALIHLTEPDKKHAESKACENSLGYLSEENGVTVLNVYPDHIHELGIRLFPNKERSIYYVDPVRKDRYIDIQDYFQVLKKARVNELERLAYALGAKHFEIVFETNTKELEKAKKKANLGAKKGKGTNFDASAEHSSEEMKKESIQIEKTLDLGGHNDPQAPELVYFKDDEDIQDLIFMRMDRKNELKGKEVRIKYSTSSHIKESDAVKLKGAVSKLGGGSAGVSIMNDVLTEINTTLIYRIEF